MRFLSGSRPLGARVAAWGVLATVLGMAGLPGGGSFWAQAQAQARPQAQWQARDAAEGAAQAQLQAFVQQVAQATGRFTQTTLNRDGQTVAQQSGEFAFARPGRFRWVVMAPFQQLIVANGRDLVQYDPDLAQATVRPVDAAVGNAPAQILFGQGDLQASFDIAALPSRGEQAWLRATPRSAEAGFAYLDIGLLNGLPVQVEILDAFGQLSRIEFVTLVPGGQVDASAFEFEVPEGVDVVRLAG